MTLPKTALQQLARGKVSDEIAVGGHEVVLGKMAEGGPAHVLKDEVLDLAGVIADKEELQVDCSAAAIVVAHVRDAGADDGFDAEFFCQLAAQRLFGGFARLDLATGELPLRGERLVWPALADEHLVAAQDQTDDNLPYCTGFGGCCGARTGRLFGGGVGFRLCICPVLVCH